jgi:hypothetical protein
MTTTTTTPKRHWCKACRKYHPLTQFPTKRTSAGYIRDWSECRKARAARKRHTDRKVA